MVWGTVVVFSFVVVCALTKVVISVVVSAMVRVDVK